MSYSSVCIPPKKRSVNLNRTGINWKDGVSKLSADGFGFCFVDPSQLESRCSA